MVDALVHGGAFDTDVISASTGGPHGEWKFGVPAGVHVAQPLRDERRPPTSVQTRIHRGFPSEPHVPFSLLGGPLHRLGRRLGLCAAPTPCVSASPSWSARGWSSSRCAVQGVDDRLFDHVGGRRTRACAAGQPVVLHLRIVGGSPHDRVRGDHDDDGRGAARAKATLDAVLARTHRRVDAWWPEAACLLAAIGLEITGARLQTHCATGANDRPGSSLADLMYFLVGRHPVPLPALSLGMEARALVLVPLASVAPRSPPHPGPPRSRRRPGAARRRARAIHSTRGRALGHRMRVAGGIHFDGHARGDRRVPLARDSAAGGRRVFLAPLLIFTDKLWTSRTRRPALQRPRSRLRNRIRGEVDRMAAFHRPNR